MYIYLQETENINDRFRARAIVLESPWLKEKSRNEQKDNTDYIH